MNLRRSRPDMRKELSSIKKELFSMKKEPPSKELAARHTEGATQRGERSN